MSDLPTRLTDEDDRARAAATRSSRFLLSLAINPFWAIVVLTGLGFAITCLMSVAAALGDPQGPMNRFVAAYGTMAIIGEVVLLIVAGFLAMTLDRIQTLRRGRAHRQSSV